MEVKKLDGVGPNNYGKAVYRTALATPGLLNIEPHKY